MHRILLALALLLAIPTWGISILAFITWQYWAKRFGSKVKLEYLDDVEKAILFVGTHHNGSIRGTAFDELSIAHVERWLVDKGISHERRGPNRHWLEFQLPVAGKLFDVAVSREPDGQAGAVFLVRASERWLDEVYCWMRDIGASQWLSKYFIVFDERVIIGAAHNPEYRPDTPFQVPDNIHRLRNLKTLGLIHRHIILLPSTIGRLIHLEELKLGGNELTEIPDELCDLENLRILTLWSNRLKRLPEMIGNLRRLEGLDISGNDLRSS